MRKSLTEDVLNYQRTGDGWKELNERISLYIYRYPARFSDWDEDRCSEFYLAFHPRIPRLIRRFRPDYSFETYLSSCLKWFMRSFSEKILQQNFYDAWWTSTERISFDNCGNLFSRDPASLPEELCRDRVFDDSPIRRTGKTEGKPILPQSRPKCRNLPEESGIPADPEGRISDPALRRRVLFLTLLMAVDLDSRQLETAARMTGVEPRWLFDTAAELTKSLERRLANRERLRCRRNECWYRMESASRRRQAEEVQDGYRYREWKRREQTWRKRYRSACEGLNRIRVRPSHREIGRLLNTPAGTVSSGIHLIRKIPIPDNRVPEDNGAGLDRDRSSL